jgi:NAD(P)-dependent dehydrogenase (short-subunit alcohol dehydrogenase family)
LKDGDQVFGVSRTQRHWKEAFAGLPEGSSMHLYELDLTDESAVKKFIHGVHRTAGRIDLLINSAGYGGTLVRTEKLSSREFKKIMDGNLLSTFLTCKYAIPVFKKQKKGTIINISSMAGQRAVPQLAAYSASKFGVLALSQAIAKENPDGDIQCITVCPGGMNTKMRSDLFGAEDAQRQQHPDFVADIITRVLKNQFPLLSGSDIVIRHGKVTAVHPPPSA